MHKLLKEEVWATRQEFFEQISSTLKTPPQKIDECLKQAQYYFPPLETDAIQDEKLGDYFVRINPAFEGVEWPLAYSVWQVGERLQLAVILSKASEVAMAWDAEEFDSLWGEAGAPAKHTRGDLSFYEWGFQVPGFHQNYAIRERFILGMRHMHFRILRALRKMATAQAQISTEAQLIAGANAVGRKENSAD